MSLIFLKDFQILSIFRLFLVFLATFLLCHQTIAVSNGFSLSLFFLFAKLVITCNKFATIRYGFFFSLVVYKCGNLPSHSLYYIYQPVLSPLVVEL